MAAQLVDLSTPDVGLVIDVSGGVPIIVHWGAPVSGEELAAVLAAHERPLAFGRPDDPVRPGVVVLHADGSAGRPGLEGHRHGGRDWAPWFEPAGVETDATSTRRRVLVRGIDENAGLVLTTEIELADHGMMRLRSRISNQHPRRYLLDRLALSVPVPTRAGELLTMTGAWGREARLHRQAWPATAVISEHRGARPTSTRPSVMWALESGAGEWSGEVWAVHVAWNGNHVLVAETMPDGRRHVQGAELLHPGEICLEPGESYDSPWMLAAWSGSGLTAASWRFHDEVRARRPLSGATSRPVIVNTWDAMRFDVDGDRLIELAARAAEVGCERFVIDDGWFAARRDDHSSLGDWWPSPQRYPDGLAAVLDTIRARGLDIGLWVEPEMVSPDSDRFRSDPSAVLVTPGYAAATERHQLVVDLTRPDTWSDIADTLVDLLDTMDIRWLKWDMNRDHRQASTASGAAGTHAQTIAVSALMDTLRTRCEGLEIESCAGGGGRGDFATLEQCVRVWLSDSTDPVERAWIQQGWSLILPPEVWGTHLGADPTPVSRRRRRLGYAGLVALWGHLGVDMDLVATSPEDLADVAGIIAVHRRLRDRLHTGDFVRFDPPSTGSQAFGVYARDRRWAAVTWLQMTTDDVAVPGPWRLLGLDAHTRYRIRRIPVPGDVTDAARARPPWMDPDAETVMTGATLAAIGLPAPVLGPESGVLLELEALAGPSAL